MRKPQLSTLVLLLATLACAAPAEAQEPNFGRAVAMTANDLVVGQPVNWYGPGTVYTYTWNRGGWAQRQLLTAPDSSRMDDFGRALVIERNTLVIGAPRKHDGAGAVYVFSRESEAAPWNLQAQLASPTPDAAPELGTALALSGDDLFVGSPAAGTGAVHHFTRSGSEWALAGTLRPREVAAAESGSTSVGSSIVEGFGAALAFRDGTLLIGAPASDEGRGAVFAAVSSAGGSWDTARRVSIPSRITGERAGAGTSVFMADGQAFVGAPGAAAVTVLEADQRGDWVAVETLEAPEDVNGSQFGFAMGLVGAELWVGAPGIQRRNGRVFRFSATSSGGWGSPVRVDPDDTSGASWPLGFGYALASAGNQAVVSMPSRDFGEGRVMALSQAGSDWAAGDLLEGNIYRIGSALEEGDRCAEGVMTEFPCTNMELIAHMPISDLGGERGVWVNDVWGWTDPETARRYALVARRDGASFIDVTNAAAPRLVGNLPRTVGSPPSVWRDIKVIGEHAYVVSDGAGEHGMQVFDLTRLRDVGAEAVDFEPDTTYHEVHSAHNVVADTTSKFLYIVAANGGGRTCGGGLHMVDASDPINPQFAGCYHDTASPGARGATHSAWSTMDPTSGIASGRSASAPTSPRSTSPT